MSLNYFFCNLVAFLFFSHLSTAQETDLKNFTHKDGLPSNEVYDIFQDKNGFLWFATDRGLASYNGHEFKKFEPKHGLTDITIFDFFPQENGQVWCITFNNKLFYFDDGSSKFIPYKYNSVIEKLINNIKFSYFFVNDLAVDKKGTLHIVTNGGMYIRIDAQGQLSIKTNQLSTKPAELQRTQARKYIHTFAINKKQVISYLSAAPSGFIKTKTDESTKRIIDAGQNRKILFTEKSVFLHVKNQNAIQISQPNHEPIECGLFDADHLWISYRGKGVWIYDYKGNLLKKYLNNHSVTEVFKDSYGSLWFSTTDAGIFQVKKKKINNALLQNLNINSLTKDNVGNLYSGCYNGDIYKIDQKGTVSKIHAGIQNRPALVQYSRPENTTYFSSDNMVFNSFEREVKYLGLLKMSDDNDNLILVRYGVYNVLAKKEEIFSDTLTFRIHDISEADGKYFLATIKGLKVRDKGVLKEKTNPLLNFRIDDIDYEPKRKLFYLASLGGGVIVYNPKNEKVFNIDKSKGLSNDLVTEVYIENENVIWACTNYGLNRIQFFNDGNYKVNYITTADGLSENQIRDVEIIGDTIYAGTTNGLCSFSMQNFTALFSQRNYFLRLKKIAINNKKENQLHHQLDLKHNENQLDFFIESVSFNNKDLLYRYKLEGLHRNWNFTANRKISYEFLPPGNYTLIVQVLEDNRLFSTEKIMLPIHINEPFWKTWWFLLMVVCLSGSVIYLFFKIRVLTYNEDIIRELLRLMVKKIRRNEKYFKFREQGKDIRVKTETIFYIKSSGNYIDIVTAAKTYTVRCKIGDFITQVPDPFEFLRIHRSYIIRIDKVEQKTRKSIFIGQQEIPVGETYLSELNKIVF